MKRGKFYVFNFLFGIAKKLLTTFTRADSPSGGCLFPDALLQLQDATHALVNALLCDFTDFHSLDYRVESLREHTCGPSTMSTPALMQPTAASPLVYCWVMAPISIASVMMRF